MVLLGPMVATASSVPRVNRCPIPKQEDFRCSVAESLPETRVKRTQGWSANGPDGSCGGMVWRRNLKGGAGGARSMEVSTIPMQVDLRVHDDVALREIELYAEVLTAVAASDGPLSKSELDEALGIRHRR
jgi:hypothetical protein